MHSFREGVEEELEDIDAAESIRRGLADIRAGRSWADLPMDLDWSSRFLLHLASWPYWPPEIVLEMGVSDKGVWFEYCDPDEDDPPFFFFRSRWRAQFSSSRLIWHITRLGKVSEKTSEAGMPPSL